VPIPRPRLLLALATVALLFAGLGLGLAHSPGMRRGAAKSLRSALGPPTPPPLLIAEPGPLSPAPSPPLVVIPLQGPSPEPALPAAIPAPASRPPDLRGVSFVLLLGADNRDSKVTGRTDTIMLAAFRDRENHVGEVAALSIPRDLWVPLPEVGGLHEQGRTHARISSVVRIGEVRLGPGQGLPLLRQVLHEQLGIRVDRYASVDFAGFVGLIDELGGVEVEVECPIQDCFWPREGGRGRADAPGRSCTLVDIPAGRVRMDGETALAFVRSRHGTGDHDRTRRQQAVVLAFAREVRTRGLRGLRRLWDQAAPYVDTDLSVEDAAYYASFALETDLREIHGLAIRHPLTQRHVTEDGKHVLLLEHEAFAAALGQLFEGELPAHRPRKRCPAPDAALR
jgi:LCP family protein required for cell wall assembly